MSDLKEEFFMNERFPRQQNTVPEQTTVRVKQTVAKSETRNPSGRSLGQILIVLVVLLVLVNIPINDASLGLAHLTPERTSLIIHDGLLLQPRGSEEIYRLENHQLRRISSPKTLRRYFNANNVQLVDGALLTQFGQGQPIRQLVMCPGDPHVYALENGQKRWVKEPPPMTSRTKSWDRVHPITCGYLARLPEGLPISENTGRLLQP